MAHKCPPLVNGAPLVSIPELNRAAGGPSGPPLNGATISVQGVVLGKRVYTTKAPKDDPDQSRRTVVRLALADPTTPARHHRSRGIEVYIPNAKDPDALPNKDDYVLVTGTANQFRSYRDANISAHPVNQISGDVTIAKASFRAPDEALPDSLTFEVVAGVDGKALAAELRERLPGAKVTRRGSTITIASIPKGKGPERPAPYEMPKALSPIRIGDSHGAIHPPTESVGEGVRFWKDTLYGELVHIEEALVVGASHRGAIHVVPAGGRRCTGLTALGAMRQSQGDDNPEVIAVSGRYIRGLPQLAVGSKIPGGLTGIVSYRNGKPVLDVIEPFAAKPKKIESFVSPLRGDDTHMVVVSMNLENFKRTDTQRADLIAKKIVHQFHAPDVLTLQEVQDDDGPTDSEVTSSKKTMQNLLDAIEARGGPAYSILEVEPKRNTSGGQPGGNIRVVTLIRKDRVALADGKHSLQSLCKDHPAFNHSRKSLAAKLVFLPTGVVQHVTNSHLSSKLGSTTPYGQIQPAMVGGAAQRYAQAAVIYEHARALHAENPRARLMQLGDLNERSFEHAAAELSGGTMVNLLDSLPPDQDCSYIYDGNAGSIDHCVISSHMQGKTEMVLDTTNPRLPDGDPRKDSDHGNPIVRADMTPSEGDEVVEPQRLAELRAEAAKHAWQLGTRPEKARKRTKA